MPSIPTRDEIDAAARRLGIADDNGQAYRRDRAKIVEAIQTAHAQSDADRAAASQPESPVPTADRIAALRDDLLRRTYMPGAEVYNITAHAAGAIIARYGLHTTHDEEGPTA